MKKTILSLMTLATLTLTLAVSASASLMTYSESDTISGTLGGTAFTNALVTFTLIADTSNITYNPNFYGQGWKFYENKGVTTAQVAGITGTATLTGAFEVYSFNMNNGKNSQGFTKQGTYITLLANTQPADITLYDLASAYTSTGTQSINFKAYPTTMGNLTLTSAAENATFTAVLGGPAAVPEPSTYALLCISLGVVGYARRKMGKQC